MLFAPSLHGKITFSEVLPEDVTLAVGSPLPEGNGHQCDSREEATQDEGPERRGGCAGEPRTL